MDDLLTVVSELSVDPTTPNNPSAPHPRFSGIKSRKPCDQAKRRAYLLAEQKRRRANVFNSSRDLGETTSANEEPSAQKRPWQTAANSDLADNLCRSVEETKEYGKKLCLKQNQSKSSRGHFKGELMLSEWLVDVPEDLEDAWYMVPCPEGKRSCVYSSVKKTKAFTRHGYSLLNSFKSTLPKNTTLDCIWSAANGTFYVIDVLEWNGMSVLECEMCSVSKMEANTKILKVLHLLSRNAFNRVVADCIKRRTEFRFAWLQGKFKEMEDVLIKSPENSFAFVLLPFYACNDAIMSDVMSCYPMFPNDVPCLDGLLFYHTATHYCAGPTPLVGWLKPSMLPEVLGITIAEDFKWLTKQKKCQIKGRKLVQPSLPKSGIETMETEPLVPVSSDLMLESSEQLIEIECATEARNMK